MSDNKNKLRLFVSSVQKELATERLAVLELVRENDPFLNENFEVIRFEDLPATTEPTSKAYLKALEECDIYLGIIGNEYGKVGPDGFSSVHREYLYARKKGMEIYVFIKGKDNSIRNKKMISFLKQIRDPRKGHKYKRFENYIDLKQEARGALLNFLQTRDIIPSIKEDSDFMQSLAAASDFEKQQAPIGSLNYVDWEVARTLVKKMIILKKISKEEMPPLLTSCGLALRVDESGQYTLTNAGLIMLSERPDIYLPQVRICVDVYSQGDAPDPSESYNIVGPLPKSIQKAFELLSKSVKRTYRIVGFKRINISEYPDPSIREAIINATAHRDYKITGATIRVEKYPDKIVVASPGLLPPPLTLPKIRSLKYRPVSRNPFLARALSCFENIEERGRGIKRMQKRCLDHGLKAPSFAYNTGYFEVVFHAPKSMEQVRVTPDAVGAFEIMPSVIEQLNNREKRIIKYLLDKGRITTREVMSQWDVVADTAKRDFRHLLDLNVIRRKGRGRSVSYVLNDEFQLANKQATKINNRSI